jgi:hypothetical protein
VKRVKQAHYPAGLYPKFKDPTAKTLNLWGNLKTNMPQLGRSGQSVLSDDSDSDRNNLPSHQTGKGNEDGDDNAANTYGGLADEDETREGEAQPVAKMPKGIPVCTHLDIRFKLISY